MSLVSYLLVTVSQAFRRLRGPAKGEGSPSTPPPERSLDLARLYHALRRDPLDRVDETTWQDLAMDEVFQKLDLAVSMPGRQLLYHRLRVLEQDEAVLEEATRQYGVLQAEEAWVAKARKLLRRLDNREAAWVPALLMDGLPEGPRHPWIYYLCGLLPALLLLGGTFWPGLYLGALALVIPNILINEIQGTRMVGHFPALAQLHGLLRASEELACLPGAPSLPQVAFLKDHLALMRTLRGRLGILSVDRTRMAELTAALFGYLNLFFLLDIVAYLRALPALRRHQGELLQIFEAFGSLDAAMAVTDYAAGQPCVTTPVFTSGPHLEVTGLCHPLLATPVGNALVLQDRSALITGSNMAGKTTFIRAVGINVLLGRTVHLCLARKALLPKAVVRSSIRRGDRLLEGQSTYFVELQRLLEFVREAGQGVLHLFLIDEIFRGTNTVERVAASIAVLRHLGQGHLVLVTTHDLELGQALANGYDLYHFSEQVVDGNCGFDFRLRPGPARSGNAIKLLELSGYPEAITREARLLAEGW